MALPGPDGAHRERVTRDPMARLRRPGGPGMTVVRLTPMTWEDFDPWSERSTQGFANQQLAAGVAPGQAAGQPAGVGSRPAATAYAAQAFADLLPDGLATPLHRFWTAHLDDGSTVGHLWVRIRPAPDEVEAYVFDVEIVPGSRGRGLGRAVMLAAEAAARDAGASVMRLNVFGHNAPALALYDGLGYAVSRATFSRRLDVAPTPVPVPAPGPLLLRDMTEQEYVDLRSALDVTALDVTALDVTGLDVTGLDITGEDRLDRLLPDGPATSGHRLWTVLDGRRPVGRVWLQLQDRPDELHARVRVLEVAPELRRRGYGRATALAVESACRELDVRSVWVVVSEPGTAERTLLERSGLELRAQTMAKAL